MDKVVGLITSILIALCICQCYNFYFGSDGPSEGSNKEKGIVLFNNKQEHEAVLKQNMDKTVLVCYFMDNCRYCDEFMPVLNKIAQKNNRSDVIIAAVEASKDRSYGISSFPTVVMYSRGNVQVISDRSYNSLIATLNLY